VASVEVVIGGVSIVLQGVQVRQQYDDRLLCQAPQWRHPRTGQWLPCLLLPEELSHAIGREVNAKMVEMAA
jgi:hypothetical protein